MPGLTPPLNPDSPDRSGSDLSLHEIVRAGAGAGKTRKLTLQVMDIARAHREKTGELPRIVVTTFTRKATQELRERLMLRAMEDEPDLIGFVNSRSHLLVSTIHGVLDVYLKRYGRNLCIDPGYQVMGRPDAEKLAKIVLRDVFFRDPELQELLELYNFNRVVTIVREMHETSIRNPDMRPHDEASFIQVFGDHTRNLVTQARETAAHIRAETDKADWIAMSEQISEVAGLLKTGDWSKDRQEILRRIASIKTARYVSSKPAVSEETNVLAKETLKRLRDLDSEAFNPATWAQFFHVFSLWDRLGRAFSDEYQALKIRRGTIEISDLELLAMDCLRKHPETAEAFSQDWDYWLIDEYQDTSPFQVELLRGLTGDRPNFIVGDPQQSIYLFRGARSEVFAQKEKEITTGGGEQSFLTRNYRSRPELLSFFNDFFAGFEPPFSPMEPFLPEGETLDPSRVVASFAIFDEPDGSEGESSEEEAEPEMMNLLNRVQSLLATGAAPGDICVLARTNQHLRDIAEWLERYQLPAHVHAASGFYDRREIQDALALLKFLVNPHDNLNLIQLLRSPWFRVPDEVLVRYTPRASVSYWMNLSGAPEGTQGLDAVRRLRIWLSERESKGITQTFGRALIEAGFVDFSHRHDVTGRRESNLWKLVTKLRCDERKPGFNYLNFIDNSLVDLSQSEGNEEGDAVAAVEPDRINLMTIHASKGLQFRHVILPHMDRSPRLTSVQDFSFDERRRLWSVRVPMGEALDMTSPLVQSLWLDVFQQSELQEHARVLYVALTRAVETVYLSWTRPAQKNSWADSLRWNLEPGLHSEANYTFEVTETVTPPREAQSQVRDYVQPRAVWSKDDTGNKTPESIHSVSVTGLLERNQAYRSPARLSPDRIKVASEGAAVHRLMELLKYPSARQLQGLIQKWFPDKEESVLAAVEFVRELERPPLLELIRHGHVEWSFAFQDGAILVEGQLDLWGRLPETDEVWIVDYKTGNSKMAPKAFAQMALYSLALRHSGLVRPDEPIHLAAVYPFAEKVFIEQAPDAQTVRRQIEFSV